MGSNLKKFRMIINTEYWNALASGVSEPRAEMINQWKADSGRGFISRYSLDGEWGHIEVNQIEDRPDELGDLNWAEPSASGDPDPSGICYVVPSGCNWAMFTHDMLTNPEFGLLNGDPNW